jgi:hypothetical protein
LAALDHTKATAMDRLSRENLHPGEKEALATEENYFFEMRD